MYNVGYSISPLTASVINNFFDDVVNVVTSIGTSSAGIGLLAVSTTGSNLGGNGQITNPLYLTDLITVTDVHTNNLSSSGQITASYINIANNLVSSKITASYFHGDGNKLTNLTASNITNFSSDVRMLISGSQYVTYNSSSGVISLPYTGSILGTTPLILGETTLDLFGLNNLSASAILANSLTASNAAVINILSASNALIGNLSSSVVTFGGINIQNSILVQQPSVIQSLNAGSTIQLTSGITRIISSTGGNITLTSTPTITTSGVQEGTRLTIINIGSGVIRLQTDTSFGVPANPATKLRLLTANQDIGLLQSIELMYISGSTGFFWAQLSRT